MLEFFWYALHNCSFPFLILYHAYYETEKFVKLFFFLSKSIWKVPNVFASGSIFLNFQIISRKNPQFKDKINQFAPILFTFKIMVSEIWDYTHFWMMTESDIPQKNIFCKVIYFNKKISLLFCGTSLMKEWSIQNTSFTKIFVFCTISKYFGKKFPWSFLVILWPCM